jgi:DNA-binding MarR family transcriptional regulator
MSRRVTTPTPEPTGAVADPAVVARLRLVVARLYRQMVQASGRPDLTLAQLSALAKIEEHGSLRLGELATLEGVAGPSMIRTIGALADGSLVRRDPDPRDGRSSFVSVTPAGTRLLAQIRRDRSEMLARRVAQLTDEQRLTLTDAVPVLELLLFER